MRESARVQRWSAGEVAAENLDAFLAMRDRAFAGMMATPSGESRERQRAGARARWVEGRDAPRAAVMHAAWHEGQPAATGESFVRTIQSDAGPIDVLALGAVASHPDLRGRGYGRAVVLDAFARVDELGARACLFQTGRARGFYERLGARCIDNWFCDRTSDLPLANPWPDRYVMIYPGDADWPSGDIDLNGPAY